MPDSEYFIPIYKDCDKCGGSGTVRSMDAIYVDRLGNKITQVACRLCGGEGKRATYIPLDEFADLTGLSSEALHNLKCHLKDS